MSGLTRPSGTTGTDGSSRSNESGGRATGDEGQAARATVDVRTLALVLAVAAALLMAYFVGALRHGDAAQAATDTASAGTPAASSDEPTMVMTGTGKATGVPDEMTFRVAIHQTAADVSTALAQANRTATDVLHRLRTEGVAPLDIKTTGLSIRPVYAYSSSAPPVITGYAASESMSVAVKDLATSGRVLGATADAGGNAVRISSIKLGIADQDALMKQARQDAVAEATAKAKEYAAATGQSLGKVISVREVTPGSSIPPVPTAAYRAEDLAASAIVPIRTGRSPLQVTVAIVWSLT